MQQRYSTMEILIHVVTMRLFYFFIDPTCGIRREKGTHPEAVDAEKMESSVILVAITVTENHQNIQLLQRPATTGAHNRRVET